MSDTKDKQYELVTRCNPIPNDWFDDFKSNMKKEIIEILIGGEQYTLDRRGNIYHSYSSNLELEFVLRRKSIYV